MIEQQGKQKQQEVKKKKTKKRLCAVEMGATEPAQSKSVGAIVRYFQALRIILLWQPNIAPLRK